MNILVTGANGFIGKNLIAELKNRGYNDIFKFDKDVSIDLLDKFCQEAEYVFHLAGTNRSETKDDFIKNNVDFTKNLLKKLKKYSNNCPVMISSSIHAELTNPYGESKKASENLVLQYSKETGNRVLIYRLQNIFGKWCKPNYNSVIATFAYNISRNIPIVVDDSDKVINLIYIDDVVNELINNMNDKINNVSEKNFYEISIVYKVSLGDIVKQLYFFKSTRQDYMIPNFSKSFTKKLYSTYISYLPEENLSYILKSNTDERGSFTEFLKTIESGQISINVSKPGIVKGNHWHHSKTEKFLVVNGMAKIQLRNIYQEKIVEYYITGNKLEVVDVPPGYTHNIENIGESDLVTIIWVNEIFNRERADTYFLEV